MSLPLTQRLITTRVRPSGTDHHMVWESLTHAETGNAGFTSPVLRRPGAAYIRLPRLRFTGAGQFEVLIPGQPERRLDGSALSAP